MLIGSDTETTQNLEYQYFEKLFATNYLFSKHKKAVFNCFYIIPSACIHLSLLIPNLENGSCAASFSFLLAFYTAQWDSKQMSWLPSGNLRRMLVNYKDNRKKGQDDILLYITEGRDDIQRNKDSTCNLSEKQI